MKCIMFMFFFVHHGGLLIQGLSVRLPCRIIRPVSVISNDSIFHSVLFPTSGLKYHYHKTSSLKYSDEGNGQDVNGYIPKDRFVNGASSTKHYVHNLFQLMRPGNFPGVALFHLIGIHLTLKSVPSYDWKMLLKIVFDPYMMTTFIAIILVTASSMIVNDFYDAKNGVDQYKLSTSVNSFTSSKPLASGELPLSVARNFLKVLYGSLLLLTTMIPSMLSRFLVMVGTIITFCYTPYFKPRTWWKNLSCAFLMAVTPLTSASASMHLLSTMFTSTYAPQRELILLISSLFFGFWGREMLMDITDADADRQSGIVTVPVKYGKTFTANVILATWITSGMMACAGPFYELFRKIVEGVCTTSAYHMIRLASFRQLILSLMGGATLIQRGIMIRRARGFDEDVIRSSIEKCKTVVLLFIAAFV